MLSIENKKKISNYIIPFVCGVILSFTQAPYHFIIPIFSISILYQISQFTKTKCYIITGISFGTGYFIFCMYWFTIPILWNNILHIIVLLPIAYIILGSMYGLAFFLFKIQNTKNPFIFVLSLFLIDYIRSLSILNMPWSYIGYVTLNSNFLAQINSIIGIHGSNLLMYIIAIIPSYIWYQTHTIYKKSIILLYVLCVYILSVIMQQVNIQDTQFTDFNTRIIQPYSMCKINDKDCIVNNINQIKDISIQSRKEKIDLLIWPEGSTNKLLTKYNYHNLFDDYDIKDMVDENMILGAWRREDQKIYYDLLLIDTQGKIIDHYDKIHPVPFGETIPFFKLYLKLFGSKTAITGTITPGSNKKKHFITKNFNIKPSICFDIAFNDYIDNTVDLIVNIANLTWYNDNNTIRKQYQDKARIKAIENRVPILSSIKNGESFIIDSYGKIVTSLPKNISGYIESKIPKKSQQYTIYNKYGKILEYLIITVIILLFAYNIFKQKTKNI